MPYLRIYDGNQSSREAELTKNPTLIGRYGGVADITLMRPTVSRSHAFVHQIGDQYFIEDAGSRSGTFLDGKRVFRKEPLRHGSTIYAGDCVLEFRTDDEARRKEKEEIAGLSAIQRVMRMNFRPLPEAVRLRYRLLSLDPGEVFAPGDTLLVANGGLLMPEANPPAEGSCIEVELTTLAHAPKTFPGEVCFVLTDRYPPALCVKLHRPDETPVFQRALTGCRRSSWLVVQPGVSTEEGSASS